MNFLKKQIICSFFFLLTLLSVPAVYSMNVDIVSGSLDKTMKGWNITLGQEVIGKFKCIGTTEPIYTIAFSPDGKYIAFGSTKGKVALCDIENDKQIEAWIKVHDGPVYSIAFSPDGQYIASSSMFEKSIKLLDRKEKNIRTFEKETREIASIAFSPDGNMIVSGSTDGTVSCWDVKTGEKMVNQSKMHKKRVHSVACTTNYIASGSMDKEVMYWNYTNNECKISKKHTDKVYSVACSPDRNWIASGSYDKTIQLWNIVTNQYKQLCGHEGAVRSVAFSPDGNFIVSGSEDKTVRVWDVATGTESKKFTGHTNTIMTVAWRPLLKTFGDQLNRNRKRKGKSFLDLKIKHED